MAKVKCYDEMNEIVFFRTNDHGTEVEVQFDGDTVWLSLNQLSALFVRDKSVISRHLRNVFQEGELERSAVVAKKATTAKDDKTYEVEFYNLDTIISVGYRVNSKRGTQFRQWATQKLKEHMVQGYIMNSKRLNELGKVVQLLEQSGQTDALQLEEAKGLLQILTNYTRSFVLLNQYDSRAVKTGKLSENISYQIQ
jgi:hypothetical protein